MFTSSSSSMKMKAAGSNNKRRPFLNLKPFLHAWKKLAAADETAAGGAAGSGWAQLGGGEADASAIPRDVPRGHTVVYVGEELRRYVVRVSCLDHPLFRELLDRARDEYGFATAADTRLCIPCEEDLFLGVLGHVDAEREWRRMALCS